MGIFLNKIKEIINKIFKKKIPLLENKKEHAANIEKDFRNDIVVGEEHKRIDLQKAYESGKIKEEELTIEQIDVLTTLYKNQIDKLDNEINKKRRLLNQQSKKS